MACCKQITNSKEFSSDIGIIQITMEVYLRCLTILHSTLLKHLDG